MPVKANWVIGESVSASAMNAVATQVNSTAGKTFYVNDFGADPTGAASSNTAVTAALSALGSNPGTIQFGPGNYKLTTTITLGAYQSVVGDSLGSTVLKYGGTGDCVRTHDSRAWTNVDGALPGGIGGPGFGGTIAHLTIDGSTAGAGSNGIHTGDFTGQIISDVAVVHFTGAGDTGILFDNTVTWYERAKVEAQVYDCTNAVVFKVTSAQSHSVSFSYSTYLFVIHCNTNQNGIILQNDALMTGCSLTVGGNFLSASTSSNSGVAVTVADTSSLERSHVSIAVETSGTSGNIGHKTLAMGSGADIRQCYGQLVFASTAVSFVDSGIFAGDTRFGFTGIINVDGTLGRMSVLQGSRVAGLATGSPGTITSTGAWFIDTGNQFVQRMTTGAQTVTISYTGTLGFQNPAEFDLFIQQPASGSTTLTWPAGFVWLSGQPPVLSTVSNAFDHIRVATPDFTTFYAQHVNDGADVKSLTNTRITPRINTVASSATPAINTDTTDVYTITALAVAITGFTMTGTPTNGQRLWIAITGTAAQTIAWGASFEASTVALPTTTVTTARLDVEFIWNAATSKWRCVRAV